MSILVFICEFVLLLYLYVGLVFFLNYSRNKKKIFFYLVKILNELV